MQHCVAVGLEWLEQVEAGETEEDDGLGVYLNKLDKKELVEILLEHACFDSNLHQKLALKASAKSENSGNFKKAIDRAMKRRTFVDYYHMPAYARGAEEVIDRIESFLDEGRAAQAIELSEHALKAAERTLGQCDDSDGYMSQILGRLQEIHLQACKAVKPDASALAKHLFEWEITSDWEVFYRAAETYRDVLGEEGLATYQRLAEAEWAKIPPLAGGKESYDSGRFHITSMMEALARATGNLEQLVEIKKRDLSSRYRYLELAQVYLEMERRDLAIEWAERGIQAIGDRRDDRLETFLADQYEQQGDDYRAMEVAWTLFATEPGFKGYPGLKQRAERLDQWERWRPKAIGEVRAAIVRRKATHTTNYYRPDSSDLVSIYLWEGDAETAWREATEGGCSPHLLLQLADKREKLHPEDALPIYKAHIENLIAGANNAAYEEAARYVQRIGKLEQPGDFALYVSALRARHKAKRNFVKLLDSLQPRHEQGLTRLH